MESRTGEKLSRVHSAALGRRRKGCVLYIQKSGFSKPAFFLYINYAAITD